MAERLTERTNFPIGNADVAALRAQRREAEAQQETQRWEAERPMFMRPKRIERRPPPTPPKWMRATRKRAGETFGTLPHAPEKHPRLATAEQTRDQAARDLEQLEAQQAALKAQIARLESDGGDLETLDQLDSELGTINRRIRLAAAKLKSATAAVDDATAAARQELINWGAATYLPLKESHTALANEIDELADQVELLKQVLWTFGVDPDHLGIQSLKRASRASERTSQ